MGRLTPDRKPLVLLDLDGVIVDLWAEMWRQVSRFADEDGFEAEIPAELLTWHIKIEHEATDRAVQRAFRFPGLFAAPEPIPGAVEAVRRLRREADVYFCSSPFIGNPTCASDKLDWVRRHLGSWAPSRTVLTMHKHLVLGDVLVDDRPELHPTEGVEPAWRQLLFTQPYNRGFDMPRLDGWGGDAVDRVLEFAVAARGSPVTCATVEGRVRAPRMAGDGRHHSEVRPPAAQTATGIAPTNGPVSRSLHASA